MTTEELEKLHERTFVQGGGKCCGTCEDWRGDVCRAAPFSMGPRPADRFDYCEAHKRS